MNIIEAKINYLEYCTIFKKLDTSTVKAYDIDLNQFIISLNEKANIDIKTITKTDISEFLMQISEKYKVKSIKRKIACLKAFFRYCELEDIIDISPFHKLQLNIKEPKRLPKSLSLMEVRNLLNYLYSYYGCKNIKYIALFELLFATGMRVSEISNLKMSDIEWNSMTITVRGKGNKERILVVCNNNTKERLREYLIKRPTVGSDYLFLNRDGNRLSEQSIRYFIKDIGMKILNKYVTPHTIRHSFATLMLEEGVDIRYIQSMLGHSSILTTQIYTHTSTTKQRQILTEFHPRNKIH